MRELRWASEEGDGIEHLVFDARDDGFAVESVVIGQRYGKAYGLHYTVRCDARWRTRYAHLKIVGGGELELHGDGEGHWHDGHGLALSAIEGCIDIDIAATPYTNTLPIRRLQLAEGERSTDRSRVHLDAGLAGYARRAGIHVHRVEWRVPLRRHFSRVHRQYARG
ncbi:hypothetical protein QFZ98_001040 [Paraburkholderia youngii]